jgi:hypothetical protein
VIKKLCERGVSPVIYLNNELKDKEKVIQAMCKLKDSDPDSAKEILPLISVFGKLLKKEGDIDFLWEREWRYPSVKGELQFSEDDIFIGICPDVEISDFEGLFPGVKFVDCQRNMKWYANKLIEARKKHPDIRVSVV